jgi:hypothetical protein
VFALFPHNSGISDNAGLSCVLLQELRMPHQIYSRISGSELLYAVTEQN